MKETVKQKSDITKKLICSLAVVFILLAAVFAFYDLKISIAVVNRNLPIGLFIEKYGEIPGVLCIALAFIMMSVSLDVKNIGVKGVLFLLNFLIAILAVLYGVGIIFYHLSGASSSHSMSPTVNIIIWLVSGVTVISTILFFKYFGSDFLKNNKRYANIVVPLSLGVFITVQSLKTLWGRVRFRDLASDYSHFTPWYLPQGDTGSHSFPSGHSFFGWITIVLFLFFVSKSRISKTVSLIFIIGWGMTVSISRVLIGAHYASDVLFSCALTVLLFLFLFRHYYPESMKT